jgi:hypothetical protein
MISAATVYRTHHFGKTFALHGILYIIEPNDRLRHSLCFGDREESCIAAGCLEFFEKRLAWWYRLLCSGA